MDRRRIDKVRVALRRGIVTIPLASRNALLEQLWILDAMADVRDAFLAAGTTQAVCLTDPQKAGLLNLIIFWAEQTHGDNDALPEGIFELRYALHDDLHQVGVEASGD